MRRTDGQFLRFCLVGTAGFLVDSAVLLMLTRVSFLGYLSGRAISFLAACAVTWSLNRAFTFRSNQGLASLLVYLSATSIGALINLTVYKLVVDLAGATTPALVLGVALGSIFALGFNFILCRLYVFRQ